MVRWLHINTFFIFHETYNMSKTNKEQNVIFLKKEVHFQVRQTQEKHLTMALYPPLTALTPPSASASMMAL